LLTTLNKSVNFFFTIFIGDFSVALAVDGPEMFNRIAKTFYSKTSMKFIILLWGEKSSLSLTAEENKEVQVFSFTEVIDLGRESRSALSDSHEASK
jgi:long-chain acyl-CoA synthetase